MVSGLRYQGGMMHTIIGITAVLITVVAVVNLGHAALLGFRLAQRMRQRDAERWLDLWLPTWGSPREAAAWLRRWRSILSAADPAMLALREDGGVVMLRHARLFAWAETWAMLALLIAA
jgi:hypothetical protein